MASILSPMMDSHSFPLLSEMPAPEGSPVGPFPRLRFPRSIWQMLLPRIVSSRCMPPPIDLPYFPLYPGVASTLSPCCLGREGRTRHEWQPTIAKWTANDVQDAWYLSPHHQWVGRVKARRGSFHHYKSSDNHASTPLDVYLGPLPSALPQLSLLPCWLYEGLCPMASVASDFFHTPLGGIAKTTECTLTGVGSSNWADVRVRQCTCTPLKTLLVRRLVT